MLRQLRATKLNFEIRGVGLVSRSGVHERMGVYLSRTGTTDEGVGVPRFENKWTWQKPSLKACETCTSMGFPTKTLKKVATGTVFSTYPAAKKTEEPKPMPPCEQRLVLRPSAAE